MYVMTTADFDNLVASEQLTLINFYATWCGPCRAMHPTIERLAQSMTDINVVRIDISDASHRDLVRRYNIVSVPTLLLFRESQMLWRESGVIPYDRLCNIVRQHQFVGSY